jgi:hypothetical protein
MKNVQPVIIVSPLAWLLITFWKPIAIAMVVLSVLIALMLPVIGQMAHESAVRTELAVPTMYIPETWRASLTQAALTPAPRVP